MRAQGWFRRSRSRAGQVLPHPTPMQKSSPKRHSAIIMQRFRSKTPEDRAWTETLLHLLQQTSFEAPQELANALDLMRHLGLAPSEAIAQQVLSEFGRRGFKVVRCTVRVREMVFLPAAGNPLLMASHAWRELRRVMELLHEQMDKRLPRTPGDAAEQVDRVVTRIELLHKELSRTPRKTKVRRMTTSSLAPKAPKGSRTPKSMKPRRPISLVGRPLQGGPPSLGKHAR